MSTLKELLDKERTALILLESAQGELTPEQDAMLTTLEQTVMQKGDAYAAVRDSLYGLVERLTGNKKELDAAIKATKNYIERFESRLIDTLLTAQKTELVGTENVLKISPTRGNVVITDNAAAIRLYGVTKEITTIDLVAIREDLDAGIDKGVAKIVINYAIKQSVNKGTAK